MGWCIGGKWCRTQECRNRCKSWFGAQPDIERACRGACDGSISFTKDEFLCSGKYVDQAVLIGAYNYDPCPDVGMTRSEYLDPLSDRQREDQQQKNYTWIIVAGLGLLGFAFWGFIRLIKSR